MSIQSEAKTLSRFIKTYENLADNETQLRNKYIKKIDHSVQIIIAEALEFVIKWNQLFVPEKRKIFSMREVDVPNFEELHSNWTSS